MSLAAVPMVVLPAGREGGSGPHRRRSRGDPQQPALTFLQGQERDGGAEAAAAQAHQVRLLRLHLQPLARVDEVQGAVLREEGRDAPQRPCTQAGAMARPRAGRTVGAEGPSCPRCPSQQGEASCCQSRRSLGPGLHLRGSEPRGAQLNWLGCRSPNGIGARRGRRAALAACSGRLRWRGAPGGVCARCRARVVWPRALTWTMVWTWRVGLAGVLPAASMVPPRRRWALSGTGCCQEKRRTVAQVSTPGRAQLCVLSPHSPAGSLHVAAQTHPRAAPATEREDSPPQPCGGVPEPAGVPPGRARSPSAQSDARVPSVRTGRSASSRHAGTP